MKKLITGALVVSIIIATTVNVISAANELKRVVKK